MTDQTFEGTFEPPVIGTSTVPIAIAGTGTLATTAEALHARGFKGSGAGLALLTFVLVTAAGMAVYHLLTTHVFHKAADGTGYGGAIVAGILSAAATTKRASKRSYELVIPWSAIKDVKIDTQRGDVVIRVKKHKPRGSLHFKSANNAALLAAILERL